MTSSSKKWVGLKRRWDPSWVLAAMCLLVPAIARGQESPAAPAPVAPVQQDPIAPAPVVPPQQDSVAPAQIVPVQPNSSAPAVEAPVDPAAQDANSLPGSSRPVGLGTSPEAPPTPAAPGGRAPSFGSAADADAWTFRIGGRISGFGQVGIGRKPRSASDDRLTLHTPPLIVGRTPIYAGPGGTLNFQYGSQTITAFVSVEASLAAQEWQGYHKSELGPRIRTAYVAVTPPPFGDLRLRFQVGAFPANYGAPGPWGWGIFGPVLAVHGYGGTAAASYDLSPRTRLSLEYGIAAVPEVDEATPRGTFTDWPEVGLSTIVHHVHAGISLENKYFAKLHLARAQGRDMSEFIRKDDPLTPRIEQPADGRMDVAALELKWVADPYGQLGVTPVYWNFKHAISVHDGIWWGLDWTAGGRDMTNKFLGKPSEGNGKIFAVSTEYDFSLKRILLHPQPFDGNGPDLRVSLAFLPFWALESADPNYDSTSGYFVGASFEHVLLPWLSTTYHLFGESRDAATVDTSENPVRGRWLTYSATAGFILHSSWQSQDRIALAYSRYFYSSFTDSNPELPLDRDVFTLGGSIAF